MNFSEHTSIIIGIHYILLIYTETSGTHKHHVNGEYNSINGYTDY